VTGATVVTIVVMLVANVVTNRWLARAYVAVCVTTAAVLLVIGRVAGLSWTELGLGRTALLSGALWGAAAAAAVGLFYLALARHHRGRALLVDDRARADWRGFLYQALVHVPVGTVLLEEVAFRGTLFGLVTHDHGAVVATVATSVLFGLWHILPTLAASHGSTGLAATAGQAPARAVTVGVAFTAAAGVVFCALRVVSGSLLGPAGLHLATNSGGYTASFVVRRRDRRG
jgi:membrane protease YdiL (CAAX protease family)